jgi:hypothetical protein
VLRAVSGDGDDAFLYNELDMRLTADESPTRWGDEDSASI